jgi:hypothetical protein
MAQKFVKVAGGGLGAIMKGYSGFVNPFLFFLTISYINNTL